MNPYSSRAGIRTDASGAGTIVLPSETTDRALQWITLENFDSPSTQTTGALIQVRVGFGSSASGLRGWGKGIPFQGGPLVVPANAVLSIVVTGGPATTNLVAEIDGFILAPGDTYPFDLIAQGSSGPGTYFSQLHADLADTGTAGHVGALISTGAPGTTHWEITGNNPGSVSGYVINILSPGQLLVGGTTHGSIAVGSPAPAADLQALLTLISGTATTRQALWDVGDLILDTGSQARGFCSHQALATAAGGSYGSGVTYGAVSTLTNVPSSITLTLVGTDNNVASVAANDITIRGFKFQVNSTAAGQVKASRTYVTVGNVLRVLPRTTVYLCLGCGREHEIPDSAWHTFPDDPSVFSSPMCSDCGTSESNHLTDWVYLGQDGEPDHESDGARFNALHAELAHRLGVRPSRRNPPGRRYSTEPRPHTPQSAHHALTPHLP